VDQRQWWNRNITDLAQRMPDGPWIDKLMPNAQPSLAVVRGDERD
jgi:putative proteasome-type protease